MRFKAKVVDDLLKDGEFEDLIVDGYIEGNFVEPNIIVGEVIEAEENYIVFEYWAKIKKETLEIVE